MIRRLSKLLRNESGITALETAIILIAFIVVASVFAFTILSAGTFSTERGKEAIYEGLEQVSSSMELNGSVIAQTTTAHATAGYVDKLVFTLGSVAGGQSAVNMSDTEDPYLDGRGIGSSTGYSVTNALGDSVVVISYKDETLYRPNLQWGAVWIKEDGDNLLEEGELIEVTIWMTGTGVANNILLQESQNFSLEVKPPDGGVISVQRRTPDAIDEVMDLN